MKAVKKTRLKYGRWEQLKQGVVTAPVDHDGLDGCAGEESPEAGQAGAGYNLGDLGQSI